MKAKKYIILMTAVMSLTAMLAACGDLQKQSEGKVTTGATTATSTTATATQATKMDLDATGQTSVDATASITTDNAAKGEAKTYSDVAKTKPE
ncbi:hypothetical protein [Paenibacillus sp. NPDC055715]